MSKVFVSYKYKDRKKVVKYISRLEVDLKENNIDLWSDNRLRPGVNWQEEIELAIQQSDIFLLFLAQELVIDDDSTTGGEIRKAKILLDSDPNYRVIIARLEKAAVIPDVFSNLSFIDLSDSDSEDMLYKRLVSEIRR